MSAMLLMERAVEAESQDIRRLGGLRVCGTSKAGTKAIQVRGTSHSTNLDLGCCFSRDIRHGDNASPKLRPIDTERSTPD
jgi:hypothetical protein